MVAALRNPNVMPVLAVHGTNYEPLEEGASGLGARYREIAELVQQCCERLNQKGFTLLNTHTLKTFMGAPPADAPVDSHLRQRNFMLSPDWGVEKLLPVLHQLILHCSAALSLRVWEQLDEARMLLSLSLSLSIYNFFLLILYLPHSAAWWRCRNPGRSGLSTT